MICKNIIHSLYYTNVIIIIGNICSGLCIFFKFHIYIFFYIFFPILKGYVRRKKWFDVFFENARK